MSIPHLPPPSCSDASLLSLVPPSPDALPNSTGSTDSRPAAAPGPLALVWSNPRLRKPWPPWSPPPADSPPTIAPYSDLRQLEAIWRVQPKMARAFRGLLREGFRRTVLGAPDTTVEAALTQVRELLPRPGGRSLKIYTRDDYDRMWVAWAQVARTIRRIGERRGWT